MTTVWSGGRRTPLEAAFGGIVEPLLATWVRQSRGNLPTPTVTLYRSLDRDTWVILRDGESVAEIDASVSDQHIEALLRAALSKVLRPATEWAEVYATYQEPHEIPL